MTANAHVRAPSTLARLQAWYERQCNGDWEHAYGVKIDTLDNPGWTLLVDLADTEWSDVHVPPRIDERTERDWVHVEVAAARFQGAGGPCNLEELMEMFLELVEAEGRTVERAR